MATLLMPDGTSREFVPKNKRAGFSLRELYALISCRMVETIRHPDGRFLVIDENGKASRPDEFNAAATDLARECYISRADHIVGPCLVCSQGELR